MGALSVPTTQPTTPDPPYLNPNPRAGSGSYDPDYLESAHKTMLYTTDELEVRFEKSSSPVAS